MKRPVFLALALVLASWTAPTFGAATAGAQTETARRPGSLRLALRSALLDYEIAEVSDDFRGSSTTRTVGFAPLSEGLGFQLHYVLSPSLSAGVGPSIRVARASDDLGDVTALGISLPVEVEVMSSSGTRRPYALASVGLRVERLQVDFEEDGTALGPELRVAAGIHAFASDRFSIDPELSFSFSRVNVDVFGETVEVRTITIGLALNFSGWLGDGDPAASEPLPTPVQQTTTPPPAAPAPAPAPAPGPAPSPFGPRPG